jgi:hypothetical protein
LAPRGGVRDINVRASGDSFFESDILA